MQRLVAMCHTEAQGNRHGLLHLMVRCVLSESRFDIWKNFYKQYSHLLYKFTTLQYGRWSAELCIPPFAYSKCALFIHIRLPHVVCSVATVFYQNTVNGGGICNSHVSVFL